MHVLTVLTLYPGGQLASLGAPGKIMLGNDRSNSTFLIDKPSAQSVVTSEYAHLLSPELSSDMVVFRHRFPNVPALQ